ncbi:MAG: 2-oxo acid dehydrogenase subunit E2 [Pseudonocardia sp.]|mgnify:FL=1|nr:2-oxo acid dehydrogenase subunit E2 [Pseudonocardia sp.]ODU04898.1 MAG: branched-chain alpha-keto acid dehydrogenase subunit E2 [Pseudonocardia sp. SCN 72-51]ODV09227.1 MAG: branched-chain alpha-keto acid dehydrogenase subunit E2 [Pseudonocardia sp. SCN 73-27]
MPDVGEGLTEAEIVAWRVAPGDTVTVNQIIAEIETAKAVVELPSPYAGTVGELLAEPGVTVEVGSPIIAIETAETAPAGAAPAASGSGSGEGGAKIGEAGADGRIATLVGYGPRQGTVSRRPRRSSAAGGNAQPAALADAAVAPAEVEPPAPVEPSPAAPESVGGPAPTPPTGPWGDLVPLAKPPVRKLARDLGVDLRQVTGSGAGGVITREDVQSFTPSAEPASAPVVAVPTVGREDRREAIRGVRKATAAAMVSSAFTAPHVTEFLSVDVTATMDLRDRLRAGREFRDVKLTPLAFVAKAVCLAAKRTPSVNATWDADAGEIVYHGAIHLGIAAATPRGLIVPKIRDADLLDLRGLADGLAELTATARSGKTPPSDLVGGTFTITNVGVFGVDTGTPIINPGEAAILAVGAIKPMPWVVDGELAVRTVCRLSLSFDHRLVDGEQGSRFLADVGALLEDPGVALTW